MADVWCGVLGSAMTTTSAAVVRNVDQTFTTQATSYWRCLYRATAPDWVVPAWNASFNDASLRLHGLYAAEIIRPLSDTVPLWSGSIVSVHLFTLATMVVCFAADCKHNNRKDKCRFFRFPSNTRNGKTLNYQILIHPKIIDLLRQMRSPL